VSDSAPRLGIQTIADSAGGVRISVVAPDGPAAAAGVLAGDQLLSIGEITVSDNMFPVTFRARYGTRAAGSPLPIVVQRAGQRLTLQSRLAFAATQKRIEELPGASARAMRLRNGILRGITTR
jgi:S1-C subfamily serine protease